MEKEEVEKLIDERIRHLISQFDIPSRTISARHLKEEVLDDFFLLSTDQTVTGVKSFSVTPLMDAISEKTAAAGVTVDGLLIKDGKAATLSSKVITATRDMTAASGDVAYTSVGFEPMSIIAHAVIGASFTFSVGFVDSAKTAYSVAQYGANTLQTQGTLIHLYIDPTNSQQATVKSFDADGFTLTWTKSLNPTGTATLHFLCFR